LERFVCAVKLIQVKAIRGIITLERFLAELAISDISISSNDALIISCGWAESEYRKDGFIKDSPHFAQALTEYLCNYSLNLLGVDLPVIDNQNSPYSAVEMLFKKNEDLLLLAPLKIAVSEVSSGCYNLTALPMKINDVSASLTRAVLTPVINNIL